MEADAKFGILTAIYLAVMLVNLDLWPTAEALGWGKLGLQVALLSGFGAFTTAAATASGRVRRAVRTYYYLYVVVAAVLIFISISIYVFGLRPLFPRPPGALRQFSS